mmetsp:Transcript_49798/g.166407  ORF Transcript_49798/g.166407 Transcript_49798/m.166407 type:complete len:233 (-) Transcript_49798:355-1053(-)
MPQSQHFTQPHGRWAPTPAQLSVLHMSYALDKFPSMSSRTDLANRLGVSPRQVQIWHQNMRQKERKSAKALQPPGGVAAPASSDINVLAAVVPPSPASYESSDEVGGEPPPEARQKRPRGEATQAAAGGSGGGGGWAEGSPVLPCSPSGLELAVGRAMQHALAQMKRQATAAPAPTFKVPELPSPRSRQHLPQAARPAPRVGLPSGLAPMPLTRSVASMEALDVLSSSFGSK